MSKDRKTPDFIKPGDNPELDRLLNVLRYDSGLYRTGEYDAFGQRRGGKGKPVGAGAATDAGAGAGVEEKPEGERAPGAEGDAPPTPVAPVVTEAGPRPAAPKWSTTRWKVVAGMLAVMSAISPVIIYAMASGVRGGNKEAVASASAVPGATAMPEPSAMATMSPTALATATSAASTVPAPSATATGQALQPTPQGHRPPRQRKPVPPAPEPQPSATPTASGPVPMFEREK